MVDFVRDFEYNTGSEKKMSGRGFWSRFSGRTDDLSPGFQARLKHKLCGCIKDNHE